jgi:hypothetical protein
MTTLLAEFFFLVAFRIYNTFDTIKHQTSALNNFVTMPGICMLM